VCRASPERQLRKRAGIDVRWQVPQLLYERVGVHSSYRMRLGRDRYGLSYSSGIGVFEVMAFVNRAGQLLRSGRLSARRDHLICIVLRERPRKARLMPIPVSALIYDR
jgi:hypothetical protein